MAAPVLAAVAGVIAINALTSERIFEGHAPVEEDVFVRKGVYGIPVPLAQHFEPESIFVGHTPMELSRWQHAQSADQGQRVLDAVMSGDHSTRIYRRGSARNALPVFWGLSPEQFAAMHAAEADRVVQRNRKPNLYENEPPRGGVFHTAVTDGVWGF